MKSKSKIEWTEMTWNPITGCTKISDGCLNCYAEKMTARLNGMGIKKYKNGFNVTIHKDCMDIPLKTKKGKMIFVNSMSDLFHEDIPLAIILNVFEVMKRAHWHTFQVLTKRSERLLKLSKYITWPDNVWMGVTVESEKYADRIDSLKWIGSKVKFISFEPLLSDISSSIDLSGIDWVIVGGESGLGARQMQKQWVSNIKYACNRYHVPFFFKQWGGVNKKKNGRLLYGRTWDEMPEIGRDNDV